MIKGTAGAVGAGKLPTWRVCFSQEVTGLSLAGGTDGNLVEKVGTERVEVKEDRSTDHSSHCGVFTVCRARAVCCECTIPFLQMSKLRLGDIKPLAHSPAEGDRMMIQTLAVPRAGQSSEQGGEFPGIKARCNVFPEVMVMVNGTLLPHTGSSYPTLQYLGVWVCWVYVFGAQSPHPSLD